MKKLTKSVLLIPIFSAALVVSAGAQSHDHGHDGHGAKAPKAGLNNGQKWQTDAPLRKGMEGIRTVLQSNLQKVHEGKATSADYEAMSKKIDSEIQDIFANCKLSPEADQVLHGVLEQMMEGSKTLQAKGGKPSKGFMQVVKAVNEYGKLFDHPGFKPVAH